MDVFGGDGRLARRVGKPVRRFLHVEASGGVVLLAAIAALFGLTLHGQIVIITLAYRL